MGQYEWILVVDGATQEIIDDIYDHYDALFSQHAGRQLLTVTFEGRNASEAARTEISTLTRKHLLRVDRSYPDLVTRSDIAERTESTVQAVGQWVRGDRMRKTPFPAPYNYVAGGIWLWGSVNDWLQSVGKPCETEVSYPDYSDHAAIDLWLAAHVNFVPTDPFSRDTQKVANTSTTSALKHWHITARAGRAHITAKSSKRLKWTDTNYEVVG